MSFWKEATGQHFTPKPSGPIKATWINPQISGDTVSILQDDVVRSWNIHFNYQTSGVNDNFMAYSFDGQLYVRASVCPPCRSKSFSLVGDTLVCDTCGTVFKAKTGAGVSGACVAYPKASVPYRIVDGKILMDKADLLSAYQKTLKPA